MLMNKLKTAAAAVLAVGVLLAGLGTFTLGRSSGAAPPEKPVPAKAAAKAAAPAPRFHVADAFKCTACHMEVHDPRWHQKFVDVEAFGRWWQPEADDATFLRRLSLDLRGLPPSALETRLFLADSDPKKRKKLVELFLNDPQMHACHHYLWGKYFGQGKTPTGDREADWKRIREEINRRVDEKLEERRKAEGIPQRLGNLLTELIGNGRSDSQVLEALSLATLGRLPTQPEQQFALTHVKGAKERKVAFENVLWALLNSKECRDHAAALTQPTAGR
jgi:hypothetical protein